MEKTQINHQPMKVVTNEAVYQQQTIRDDKRVPYTHGKEKNVKDTGRFFSLMFKQRWLPLADNRVEPN